MVICLCKGITEEKLREALRNASHPREALRRLGVGEDCGTCLSAACEEAQIQNSAANCDKKE